MKAIIDDYLFREAPPYLDGKPDHVYWAHIGSKKNSIAQIMCGYTKKLEQVEMIL